MSRPEIGFVFRLGACLAALLVAHGGLFAQDEAALRRKWGKASVEELTEALNKLAHESIARGYAVREEDMRLQEAWRDEKMQTAEIAALRKRLLELEAETLETQLKLKRAVEALPAVKERRKALTDSRAEIDAINMEREVVESALREKRRE